MTPVKGWLGRVVNKGEAVLELDLWNVRERVWDLRRRSSGQETLE